jgi:hypothetical protein
VRREEAEKAAAKKQKAVERIERIKAARAVDHSHYRNYTHEQAKDELIKKGEVGDYLFRPSTSGAVNAHAREQAPVLSLAWLFYHNVRVQMVNVN